MIEHAQILLIAEGHHMQLSNELFFALFSIVMVVAVIWFVRSASRYKAWVKSRDEKNMDG